MIQVSHRRPKRPAATVVRRESLVMPAIAPQDLIETACVGIAMLIGDGCPGVIFVQADEGRCWRITLELQEGAEG